MNDLYNFEGVSIATFYLRTHVIFCNSSIHPYDAEHGVGVGPVLDIQKLRRNSVTWQVQPITRILLLSKHISGQRERGGG